MLVVFPCGWLVSLSSSALFIDLYNNYSLYLSIGPIFLLRWQYRTMFHSSNQLEQLIPYLRATCETVITNSIYHEMKFHVNL